VTILVLSSTRIHNVSIKGECPATDLACINTLGKVDYGTFTGDRELLTDVG